MNDFCNECKFNIPSGVCESLPVQLVNDIFYLHERGQRLGYYTSMVVSLQFSSTDG
jgi:hypothetical protein